MKRFFLLLIVVFLQYPFAVHGQTQRENSSNDVVDLVVSGEGQTKDEAITNALRNAIEQAFGTFISANTEIFNDELIKDEIVSVSTGNIVSYEEIAQSTDENGLREATLKARVSISKLTSYAKNHGSSVELAGAAFVQQMKIRELNKKNELIALQHFVEKAKELFRDIYDYQIETYEPFLSDTIYTIPVMVKLNPNNAFHEAVNQLEATLASLSLPSSEIEAMKYIGLGVTRLKLCGSNGSNRQYYFLRNTKEDIVKVLKPLADYVSAAKWSWRLSVYTTDCSYPVTFMGWANKKLSLNQMGKVMSKVPYIYYPKGIEAGLGTIGQSGLEKYTYVIKEPSCSHDPFSSEVSLSIWPDKEERICIGVDCGQDQMSNLKSIEVKPIQSDYYKHLEEQATFNMAHPE